VRGERQGDLRGGFNPLPYGEREGVRGEAGKGTLALHVRHSRACPRMFLPGESGNPDLPDVSVSPLTETISESSRKGGYDNSV